MANLLKYSDIVYYTVTQLFVLEIYSVYIIYECNIHYCLTQCQSVVYIHIFAFS